MALELFSGAENRWAPAGPDSRDFWASDGKHRKPAQHLYTISGPMPPPLPFGLSVVAAAKGIQDALPLCPYGFGTWTGSSAKSQHKGK